MAAPDSCCSPCPVIPPVQVPGPEGIPGTDGTSGTNGGNAYTNTTADFVIPAVNSTVTVQVSDSNFMALGQYLFVSDGTNEGIFQVTAIGSSQSVTLEYITDPINTQAGNTMANGAKVTPSGFNGSPVSPLPVANGGTGATTAATARTNLSAAGSGVNSDITQLTGLTTALSVAQGGTGAQGVSAAAKNLSTTYRLLAKITGANMNSTADQAITGLPTKWIPRRITAQNASISLTTAAGGFYTGAGKTGTVIVPAAQVYTALTAASKWKDLTIDSTSGGPTTDVLSATTIYFALTTPQGAAATADIYIWGEDLS